MATSDMSLGGGAGFGAGYTPIRFAPLVSLTGPVMAPATPAAPEAAAPMAPALRLPQMSDMPDNAYMTGEMQQGTPGAGFVNPFSNMSGSQIARTGLDALSFFASPLGFAAQYALTGQTPSQNFQGLLGGAAQPGAPGQGTPAAPFGGFLQNLRDSFARNVFGQEEVPLFETRAPIESRGPTTIVGGNGQYIVTPDLAPIDQTNALFNDPAFYNAIVAGVPVGQMQQSNMAPILDALNQSILQGTSTMEQFGSQQTGGGFAPSDFGGGNEPDNSGISYDISDFR
jgi:hypothetical protein